MPAREPAPRPDEDEEELLEQIETLSPLTALDPDQVDKLSVRQQAFLIEFIHTGSIVTAKRKAKVTQKDWSHWSTDEEFQKIFGIVKSPLAFALNLRQAIQWRAALKLFALVNHERVSVQQWAIDRAMSLGPISGSEGPEKSTSGALTQADAKRLAGQIVAEIEEAKAPALANSPFIEIPRKQTIIEQPPEAPNTGSQSD